MPPPMRAGGGPGYHNGQFTCTYNYELACSPTTTLARQATHLQVTLIKVYRLAHALKVILTLHALAGLT